MILFRRLRVVCRPRIRRPALTRGSRPDAIFSTKLASPVDFLGRWDVGAEKAAKNLALSPRRARQRARRNLRRRMRFHDTCPEDLAMRFTAALIRRSTRGAKQVCHARSDPGEIGAGRPDPWPRAQTASPGTWNRLAARAVCSLSRMA